MLDLDLGLLETRLVAGFISRIWEEHEEQDVILLQKKIMKVK